MKPTWLKKCLWLGLGLAWAAQTLAQSAFPARALRIVVPTTPGSGSDVTIAVLAHHIANTVGYTGQIEFDASKLDGAPRKWMDSSRINALGWKPQIDLKQGLANAYQDFLNHHA